MRRQLAAAALLTGLTASVHACGSGDHPSPFDGTKDAGGAGGSAGLDTGLVDGPPSPDADGLCGNTVIPVVVERPNVYFVVDRSGSMQDPLPKSSYNKYVSARIAMSKLLRSVGHRLRYGAAVFPMPGGTVEGCNAGKEIFVTQEGDPPSYAQQGLNGPVLKKLLTVLAAYGPEGGTPTSSTLESLIPTVSALPGQTFVVLATDGAPNCNSSASCPASECTANIEGAMLDPTTPCAAPINCCDPKLVSNGPQFCVDRPATVEAVTKLFSAGIKTYVIGMPGAEVYANVLNEVATAGGTAKATAPLYYSVQDEPELTASLQEIGIKVAVSCTVDLGSAPPDKNLVNVYFDTKLVQYDSTDGWSWTSDKTVELSGEACAKLKSGDVYQVQVVAGCPTSVK